MTAVHPRRSSPADVEVQPVASIGSILPWFALAAMTLAFAALFSWLAIERHLAYQSHAFDLGNMTQALWNTVRGSPLRFTDMQVGGHVLTNRLAIHVEPLLFPLSLLSLLPGGPIAVLVLQALGVASGAIPAYLLARDVLGRPGLALVFPVAYLLHPSVQNVVLDDFHAVALTASLLLWVLLFAYRGDLILFSVAGVLAAATKEEVALLVAACSLFFLRRSRTFVVACLILGIAWFAVCVAVIIPHFNPGGHSPYLSRYRYLGRGIGGVVLGTVRHPDVVWRVLSSPSRQDYVSAVLHPLGWTSVLGLPVLLLALPSFGINMLSADPTMYSGYYQYSAEVVPFVIASSAIGIGLAGRMSTRRRGRASKAVIPVLCGLVLVASFVDSYRYGFSPLSEGYVAPSPGAHQRLEDRIVAQIPPGSAVAAADEIEPHVAERRWVYLLPTVHPSNGPPAQYIVMDASIPSLPVTPLRLHDVATRALADGYGVVRADDGILLLRRGVATHKLPASFFTFAFPTARMGQATISRWGNLRLAAVTVHPRSSFINRSRPAIDVEAYWTVDAPLPVGTRIAFYCSPVYRGKRPPFSARWTRSTDSPTWDWIPLRSWAPGATVRTATLPLLPDVHEYGKVDVAIGVSRNGAPVAAKSGARIRAATSVVRVATVIVGY